MITRPAVLVTGAARRIGASIAGAFGAAGWHVVIHYGSSRDEAEDLGDSLPSAETISANLADLPAATMLVDDLAKRLGDWRVLVNCASVFELDTVTDLDPDVFDRALHVNAAAPAVLAQAFLAQ